MTSWQLPPQCWSITSPFLRGAYRGRWRCRRLVIQAGWAGRRRRSCGRYTPGTCRIGPSTGPPALAGAEAEIAAGVRGTGHAAARYEEQSSDWLWTVNRERLRTYRRDLPWQRTDRRSRRRHAAVDLFLQEDRDRLASHLRDRNRFRDLVVKVPAEDAIRYWKLSARPRSDGRMSGVARDVTGDRVTEDRVAFMAHYDNLTGLANRYLFNDRLRAALAQEEQARSVVLFYLDLDDFKAVNDSGHRRRPAAARGRHAPRAGGARTTGGAAGGDGPQPPKRAPGRGCCRTRAPNWR